MSADDNKATPCIYLAACRDCSGLPEAIAVRLTSGEVTHIEHVVEVRVTDREIILKPAEASDQAFPRSDVYYAGCARCLPPFLS